MTSYVVEAYLSRLSEEDLAVLERRARRAAAAVTRAGRPVRYVRSVFLPEDETCLHFFEAVSAEAVGQASEQAEIPFERIVEALA
jgi:hypothetical protein